jgi:hypothetical protein
MRRLTILGALAVALAVAATAAAKPPTKPAKASKPTITKAHAPKGSAAKGATIKGSASKGSTVKTKAKGTPAKASRGKSVKLAKTDAKVAKANVKTAKADARTKAANGTASGNTHTSAGAIDFSATALGQKLQKNSALRSKIEAKLAAAGYTGSVYEAAFGFKNLGQLNAATNQVQNHGYSFELLKVLMTGTYVDPDTHLVYRASRLADGTVKLVTPELATGSASTLSLGQAKQAIAGGAVMPEVAVTTPQPGSGSF